MVRELYVETPEPTPSWEEQVELFYDFSVEGIPLPEKLQTYLSDEYLHLIPVEARLPENARAWTAYKSWVGDIVEDPRTPRERLETYFLEQERV